MLRTLTMSLFLGFAILTIGASGQSAQPKIDIDNAGQPKQKGQITVQGKIQLPTGWKMSNNVVTVRHQVMGGKATYNTIPALEAGLKFTSTVALKPGTYTVWAVTDARGPDNREKNVSSTPIVVSVE
jgi:uncharacterized protein (DUF2141 family)